MFIYEYVFVIILYLLLIWSYSRVLSHKCYQKAVKTHIFVYDAIYNKIVYYIIKLDVP